MINPPWMPAALQRPCPDKCARPDDFAGHWPGKNAAGAGRPTTTRCRRPPRPGPARRGRDAFRARARLPRWHAAHRSEARSLRLHAARAAAAGRHRSREFSGWAVSIRRGPPCGKAFRRSAFHIIQPTRSQNDQDCDHDRPRACLVGCMTAEQRAAADDSYCRSIGAQRGTPVYVECRLRRDETRQADSRAAAAQWQANRPRNCVSYGSAGVQCF